MKVWSNEFGYWQLKDIEKVKEPIPLFITSDKVSLYNEDDEYFRVYDDYSYGKFKVKNKPSYEVTATFSTKEAAEEYILMNKPCLSVMDLKTHFNSHHFGEGEYQLKRLKELAKSKI